MSRTAAEKVVSGRWRDTITPHGRNLRAQRAQVHRALGVAAPRALQGALEGLLPPPSVSERVAQVYRQTDESIWATLDEIARNQARRANPLGRASQNVADRLFQTGRIYENERTELAELIAFRQVTDALDCMHPLRLGDPTLQAELDEVAAPVLETLKAHFREPLPDLRILVVADKPKSTIGRAWGRPLPNGSVLIPERWMADGEELARLVARTGDNQSLVREVARLGNGTRKPGRDKLSPDEKVLSRSIMAARLLHLLVHGITGDTLGGRPEILENGGDLSLDPLIPQGREAEVDELALEIAGRGRIDVQGLGIHLLAQVAPERRHRGPQQQSLDVYRSFHAAEPGLELPHPDLVEKVLRQQSRLTPGAIANRLIGS